MGILAQQRGKGNAMPGESDAREQYLPLGQAASWAGISRHRLRALIRSGALPVYRNPRDTRTLLVRVSELERALQPVPAHLVQQATSHHDD